MPSLPPDISFAQCDLSTNGRYALFESSASDLIAGSTNNTINVFMRDLVSGTTFLVSASTNAGYANGPSYGSVMTPDGRYVVTSLRRVTEPDPALQPAAVFIAN